MRRSTFVRALAVLVAAAAVVAGPAGAPAAEDPVQPVVTGAVQVTSNPNAVRAHMLPLIARNPKNGELVIAEVDGRGSRECVVHLSTDNGRSWFNGGGFMVKPFTDCSIGAEYGPAAMPFFDRNGVLYVAFSANDPAKLLDSSRPVSTTDVREDIPRNAYLARSTDGGRSFTTTLVHAGKEGNTQTAYVDAPSGAVDPARSPVRVRRLRGRRLEQREGPHQDDGGGFGRRRQDLRRAHRGQRRYGRRLPVDHGRSQRDGSRHVLVARRRDHAGGPHPGPSQRPRPAHCALPRAVDGPRAVLEPPGARPRQPARLPAPGHRRRPQLGRHLRGLARVPRPHELPAEPRGQGSGRHLLPGLPRRGQDMGGAEGGERRPRERRQPRVTRHRGRAQRARRRRLVRLPAHAPSGRQHRVAGRLLRLLQRPG